MSLQQLSTFWAWRFDSDSHKTLPVINQTAERLDSVELVPFRHLFDNGVGSVMVAHLDVPARQYGGVPFYPFEKYRGYSFARKGFKGLAFTDALSMKGFADFVGDRLRARDALLAENDVLLFPGDPVEVIEELRLAIEEGTLDSASVAEKCGGYWPSFGLKRTKKYLTRESFGILKEQSKFTET